MADSLPYLGAIERRGRAARLLGVARWDRADGEDRARLAVTVRDGWHGRGIGSFLIRMLARHARRQGLAGLRAEYGAGNSGMEAAARAAGGRTRPIGRGWREAAWELSRG